MTRDVVAAEVGTSAVDQPGTVAIVHDYLTREAERRGWCWRCTTRFRLRRSTPPCTSPISRSRNLGRRHTAVLLESLTVLEATPSARFVLCWPIPSPRLRSTRRSCSAARAAGLTGIHTDGDKAPSTATARLAGSTRVLIIFAGGRTLRTRGDSLRPPAGQDPQSRSSSEYLPCRVADSSALESAGQRPARAPVLHELLSGLRPDLLPVRDTAAHDPSRLPCCTIDGPSEKPHTRGKEWVLPSGLAPPPVQEPRSNVRRVRATP